MTSDSDFSDFYTTSVPKPPVRKFDVPKAYELAQAGAKMEEIRAFFGYKRDEWDHMMNDKDIRQLLEVDAPLAGAAAIRMKRMTLATKGDDKALKALYEAALNEGNKPQIIEHKFEPLQILIADK